MRRVTFSWDMAMWVVSAVALALSLFNWAEANRPADIRLVLATQVRLSVGPTADIYLQPVFVSTAANDRAEVIDTVTATLTPTAGGSPIELVWYQTGVFDVGPNPDYVVNWKITNLRPEPIVITSATPQTPILRFHTASALTWAPGTYRVDLRAHRLVSAEPLTGSLAFDLGAAGVAQLSAEGPSRFVSFDARAAR